MRVNFGVCSCAQGRSFAEQRHQYTLYGRLPPETCLQLEQDVIHQHIVLVSMW